MMKNMKLYFAAAMALISTMAFSQINVPLPSPPGSVSSQVGITDVTIDYFRPKVKGRKIFGPGSDYLQPYGNIWRTGANSGSKLTLSTEATIAGQKVEAGEYLIFTIPGKDEWSFMLYSDLSIGGNVAAYDKEKEVLRTTVEPMSLDNPVETLTFNISDISADNKQAKIQMSWADVSIKVPMEVDFHDAVMKEISAKTQVNPGNYTAAASYYLQAGEDLGQALEWMNKYLSMDGNDGHFWHIHTKAKILAKMGKKKEAMEAAKESMEKAENYPNGDFGYIKRNKDLIAEIKKM